MHRRSFLKGAAISAVYAASALPAVAACDSPHKFARLKYRGTDRLFRPNPNKFGLVLFMTAQDVNPSCGEAFAGVQNLMGLLGVYQQKIQPILVVPESKYQPDPHNDRNLRSAKASKVDFDILEGDIDDIRGLNNFYGEIYEAGGSMVSNHGVDLFFLPPGQGLKIVRQDAVSFLLMRDQAAVTALGSMKSVIDRYDKKMSVQPGFCM